MKKLIELLAALTVFGAVEVSAQNLTLGKIQQTVQKGVTKEKIIEELGSPNMVTGSSADQETWIYDKVSTTVQSEVKSEGSAVIGGVFGGVFGIGGKSSNENISGSKTTSQKTLTLIIKFKGEIVDSYATRMSSF
jgi:outer membrane protein assembly factor BamE (lipoprotein component of BamABCDE complex)